MDFASMVMSPQASLLIISNPVDLAVRIRMMFLKHHCVGFEAGSSTAGGGGAACGLSTGL